MSTDFRKLVDFEGGNRLTLMRGVVEQVVSTGSDYTPDVDGASASAGVDRVYGAFPP